MGRFWIYWTYHKDSYMAHRKDFKNGYEGRYRRTHSPSAQDRNSSMTSSPIKPILQNRNNGILRSAVSTSSLLQRPTSPLDNESVINNSYNNNENSLNNNQTQILNRNNEWTPHCRQPSTVVNFTTEELRAFQARKSAKDPEERTNNEDSNLYKRTNEDVTLSPIRPLSRAVSMGDTLHSFQEDVLHHHQSSALSLKDSEHLDLESFKEEDVISSGADSLSENASLDSSSVCNASIDSDSVLPIPPPLSSPSNSSVKSNSIISHDGPITAHPATVTEEYSNPVSPVSSPPDSSLEKHQASHSMLSNSSSLVSSVSSPNISNVSSTCSSKTSYLRSLSGTCPSMTSKELPPEDVRQNIVVLGYGRTPNEVEVTCSQLGQDYVKQVDVNKKLHTLLALDSGHKSAADYMEGIFAFELRADLLCESHAQHPDLRKTLSEPMEFHNSTSNKAPLSADSAYFTISESKAKFLSTFREKSHPEKNSLQSQSLKDKKEKLISSIAKKLDILRCEQSAIKEEIALNIELGTKVSLKIESEAKSTEFNKYKLHVEEIDKITSLLLSLSGRLARVENALMTSEVDSVLADQKLILEGKRDKLAEQLEEAKKLKENIDRRAIQVSKIVTQYLNEDEYADYDHFIKMKAKLLMDTKEIDDKIVLGVEQLEALKKNSLPSL